MFWKKCGNAGNHQICGISRTIAGWLTPMGPSYQASALSEDGEMDTEINRSETKHGNGVSGVVYD